VIAVGDERITVSFRGIGRSARVARRSTVIAAAREAGTEIMAACGARGRCRSCRVQLLSGALPPPTLADMVQLGEAELAEGYRLACQCRVGADTEVLVAAPVAENAFQVLTATDADAPGLELDCGVRKRYLSADADDPPDEARSDLEITLRGDPGADDESIPLAALRQVPGARQGGAGITVTSFGGTVLCFERGDTTAELYGVALDVGTTTVVAYLLDLRNAETVAVKSGLNPQSVHGADLVSRIGYATNGAHQVRDLRARIVRFANQLIGAACASAGVAREQVYKVVAVGNTCMHHLLLGIDPSAVGRAPFRPVLRHGYRCRARDAGLRVNDGALLMTLPLVAGFVGADTVAMVLSTRIDRRPGVRLAVDIGTNAEVVLASEGRLLACSAPAGPALEGGQIHDGMRAALGAIDSVTLDPGGDLELRTIGDAPARGICGSGLVDAAAALLDAGVIAPSGRVLTEPGEAPAAAAHMRVREDPGGRPEILLVAAADSAGERDLVLTQADVRELQLAKAAIRCAMDTLMRAAGVADHDVAELLLAGGFGNYLALDRARRIGIIPGIAPERVRYIGNAAGLGAQMALLSESTRLDAQALAARIEHVSLADERDFQQRYLAAIPF